MTIQSLNAKELKEKMDRKEEIILIDCREIHEWDNGHIPEAIHLPLSDFQNQIKTLNDKEATIVLQCRSGQRSMRAALMLESLGFTNLSNLEGGILEWSDLGYPVTPPEV